MINRNFNEDFCQCVLKCKKNYCVSLLKCDIRYYVEINRVDLKVAQRADDFRMISF